MPAICSSRFAAFNTVLRSGLSTATCGLFWSAHRLCQPGDVGASGFGHGVGRVEGAAPLAGRPALASHKAADYTGSTYELFIGLYGNRRDATRKHGNGRHLAQWGSATSGGRPPAPATAARLVASGSVVGLSGPGAGGADRYHRKVDTGRRSAGRCRPRTTDKCQVWRPIFDRSGVRG